MLRSLLLLLCVLSTSTVHAQAVWWEGNYNGKHYADWYSLNKLCCNNPTCRMRQEIIRRITEQQQTTAAPITVPSTAYNNVEYETVQVPIVTRVKHCNGVTCWYENVTTYRTERRPVKRVAQAVRNTIDLLHVTKLDPTPREAVTAMVALANPQPSEVLYDLGCGDGRILIEATSLYGCRSVGIELNADTLKQASYNIDNYGLANKIKVVQGDILSFSSYPQADIVTVYLYPELIEKLIPKLAKGTRLISYLHPFTGSTKIELKGYTFYTRTL